MRKTNNLPWMGRTVAIAVMVFVGLGVFAGQARAQSDLQNYMGWWDALSCGKMINVVNLLEINYYNGQNPMGSGTHVVAASSSAVDKARWCVMWDGLSATSSQNDAKNVKDAATMGTADSAKNTVNAITRKPSDNIFSSQQWWDDLNTPAANQPMTRRFALGLASTADDPGASYGALTRANADLVDKIYMALMPGGMGDMPAPTDAPALPLVGIGLLGLVLAGRGAWLRRRA